MLSDGVILLCDNTHTARKAQELLQKFKCEDWSQPPHTVQIWPPIWFPNTYMEQGSFQTAMRKQMGSDLISTKPGIIGDWRNYFSPTQSARMDQKLKEKFAGTGLLDLWKDEM
ncbi:hypothetical protein AVEN_252912-1 [Araneus ventricosus]|uniref:Sulfotransferase domain-containing protein n=1 Tax=Araneus ventricosus TaxID=182803 RepID=A0A4Y2FCM9_ARAVE|nr:hypothetical protein AVEN_252912-1 [Araneus ventricosus]